MTSLQINPQSLVDHLFAYTTDGLALYSRNGVWMQVNEPWCRLCGYSPEELARIALKDLVHPDDWKDEWPEAPATDSDVQKVRLFHKSKREIPVLLTISRLIGNSSETTECYVLQASELSPVQDDVQTWNRIKQQYRLMSEHSRDLFYHTAPDGTILDCAPSIRRILGYSPDELIGITEDVLYSFPPSLQTQQSVSAVNEECARQVKLLHKDGHHIWFDLTVKTIIGDNGEELSLKIGQEISDRKKNEQFIAEAQRIALMGSWEWDISSNEILFSDQFFLVSGIDPESTAVHGILSLVSEDLHPAFKEELDKALVDKELSFEYRSRKEAGADKYLHIRGLVTYSDQGIPLKINGTIQDITDRKLVERKLQETVERYTSLKKYNHDAVFSLDLEGKILNTNLMAQEMTGYAVHEMIGACFTELLGTEEITDILEASLKDNSAEKRIDKITDKYGNTVEVLTTIAPIIISEANVGYYIIAKDIREQKKLMIEKESAEATNKAKGEFLAMMSHEIRTPMNAVIGMTDLLLETTSLSSEQREYLNIIRKSGDTLLVIINDILDFSKIESGVTELVEEPFDIRTCILESVDLLTPKAIEKNLEMTCALSQNMPSTLLGDAKRLKQVLINLIGNAVKFTSAGNIMVSVKKQAHSQGTVELLFQVKDTGIGIPKEKADKLFQPFYQLDNFMTRETEGTGLGLAICKKLVQLMGGDIWVEQPEEPGAHFLFTVVLKEAAREAVPFPKDKTAAEKAYGHSLKILVAEDNRINQLVLVKMLTNQGHTVRVVDNGSEVVEAALTERYDLVFMDVHMPEINGLDAARMIKEALRPEEYPIIVAVTANALKGDREKCLAAGMDDYISKPIFSRTVNETIQKFFSFQQA
ncbi:MULTISPECIES: PAS domain S-box protein [unclassified Paenibacillus]|uniref:PAS domain S-box protein n=1 Tax=unclassified Paenibacillus TaxID=185978 RepID=UPI00020D7215|nr:MULTISPECIES: PAS domain S-box protein [unclassified Paenibacillus]EGL18766.1 PAS domain S-box protein [Paenibacillus sp. HGF7]EPD92765.1 PAS domain S-box protein [Paenibacillus sp. HGH0039]